MSHLKKETNKQKLIAAMEAEACNVTKACDRVGITTRTYHRYINEDPVFKSAIEEMAVLQYTFVEGKIMEHIKNDCVPMTIYYAKTKMRHLGYAERTQLEVTKPDEINVLLDTEEQVEKMNELLNKDETG